MVLNKLLYSPYSVYLIFFQNGCFFFKVLCFTLQAINMDMVHLLSGLGFLFILLGFAQLTTNSCIYLRREILTWTSFKPCWALSGSYQLYVLCRFLITYSPSEPVLSLAGLRHINFKFSFGAFISYLSLEPVLSLAGLCQRALFFLLFSYIFCAYPESISDTREIVMIDSGWSMLVYALVSFWLFNGGPVSESSSWWMRLVRLVPKWRALVSVMIVIIRRGSALMKCSICWTRGLGLRW